MRGHHLARSCPFGSRRSCGNRESRESIAGGVSTNSDLVRVAGKRLSEDFHAEASPQPDSTEGPSSIASRILAPNEFQFACGIDCEGHRAGANPTFLRCESGIPVESHLA